MPDLLDNPTVRGAILKLDVDQYHRLCTSGIIPERTELLDGMVVEKTGKSPLHSWTVGWLEEWLREHLRSGLSLRVEQPLTISGSEPEPDLAVVDGPRERWRNRHPSTALVVIEVAVSTEDLDMAKAAIYAAAGIPRYLLVHPQQELVIDFSEPAAGTYNTRQNIHAGGVIAMLDVCDASLPLPELFARD